MPTREAGVEHRPHHLPSCTLQTNHIRHSKQPVHIVSFKRALAQSTGHCDLICYLRVCDEEELFPKRPEVEIEEFPEIVFTAEVVCVDVGMDIWGEVLRALAGDEEMAPDWMVGWSGLVGEVSRVSMSGQQEDVRC